MIYLWLFDQGSKKCVKVVGVQYSMNIILK